MKFSFSFWLSVLFVATLTGCGLLGIHFRVHNPNKPGKTPNFSEEDILLGEMTPLRSGFDVHYYDFSLDVDHENQSLAGTVEIHAIAQRNLDTLQIDLHPNFEILSLTDKTTGKDLIFTRRERAVFVQTSRKKADNFALVVQYAGKPPVAKKAPWKGGFVWEKDDNGNPWDGVACESDGASIWWPLKDHTADEPDSMRLHYTVPKGLVGVGNGQFIEKTSEGQKDTYHWFISYPINTYNVTIYVGNFKLLEQEYDGVNGQTLKMTHYVLPENYDVAQKHFRQLQDILRVFERRFGEYPWYRDGFKLVESPYAGMEHQTAIAYGNGYKNDLDPTSDYIIVHETAHEWWGNSITARDLADVWLQEGFATYAEALYKEAMDGRSGYQNHLFFNRLMIKNKYPVVGIEDRRWFHFRDNSDVYVKGAWILHSLRNQMQDDELFYGIILAFAEGYRYQIVDSEDFISLVNQMTGKDYRWFFQQYLDNNFAPTLEYDIDRDGTLSYRWTNVHPAFTQMRIDLETAAGTVPVYPKPNVQTLQLEADELGEFSVTFPNDGPLFELIETKKVSK